MLFKVTTFYTSSAEVEVYTDVASNGDISIWSTGERRKAEKERIQSLKPYVSQE